MIPIHTISKLTAAILFAILSTALIPAFAQGGSGSMATGAELDGFNTSYELAAADITSPVTLGVENHLYYPGEEVRVDGSVWTELVSQIDTLELVNIEAKDSQGNIIARETATVENDGKYGTSFSLLDGGATGIYSVQARIELDADALGLVKAITSATLQSSSEFVVAEPREYEVTAESQEFNVTIASNSGITDVKLNQPGKRVSFFAEGSDGTTGVTEITIPKAMLSGNMTILLDQNLVPDEDVLLKSNTATEAVFEINYKHSIHRVEVVGTNVVPEFPLSILVVALAVGAIVVLSTLGKNRLIGSTPAS